MNNEKLNNLQRHLWLIRIPGLIAALLYLMGNYPLAMLYLGLETFITAMLAVVLMWIPAHQVAKLVPVPELGLQYSVLMALFLLAGIDSLVGANLLLWVVLLHKHRTAAEPQVVKVVIKGTFTESGEQVAEKLRQLMAESDAPLIPKT